VDIAAERSLIDGERGMLVTVSALAKLPVQGVVLREAVVEDVPAIVELLAADQLGATRDGITNDADLQPYLRAFDALDADPAHLLLLASDDVQVLATMQLGSCPGSCDAVRCAPRSSRCGSGRTTAAEGLEAAFEWAIGEARRRDCALGQLTTDETRAGAPLLGAARVCRFPRGAQAEPLIVRRAIVDRT